jgi:hypothetical protein
MGMRFGTWNATSPCRAGSLETVASELIKYNIRMDCREIKWESVDGMYLAQHNNQWWALNESLGSIKGGEFLD